MIPGASDTSMHPFQPSDDFFDEQFPLSAADDFLIHQTPDPIRVVATTDPRFFDRYWCVLHDDVGELMLALGGSFYPNLDRAEAYAIVNHRGDHRSVRAFRPLGADRTRLDIGPLRHEIVRGMREWRYVLEPNDWGIAFDLAWTDTKRQHYSASWGSLGASTPAGRQRDVNAGFEGFGVAEGWVEVAGRRFVFGPGGLRGTRDRHWGIGRGVGGPNPHAFGPPKRAGWIGGNWISFPEFSVWGNHVLYDYGDPRRGAGRVVDVRRRLRFEPETRIFLEGELDYTFASGETRRVHFRRLGVQTAYMRCGMYGGTPDRGIFQGMDMGSTVEGDRYDLTDPKVRARLCGLNEHHCEIVCDGQRSTGILQPLEPDAYEACAAGRPGWAFL